jgi:hypothetical protein
MFAVLASLSHPSVSGVRARCFPVCFACPMNEHQVLSQRPSFTMPSSFNLEDGQRCSHLLLAAVVQVSVHSRSDAGYQATLPGVR